MMAAAKMTTIVSVFANVYNNPVLNGDQSKTVRYQTFILQFGMALGATC